MLREIFDFGRRELASKKQRDWGVVRDTDSAPVRELHHFISKNYPKGDLPALTQILIDMISLMTDRYARNFFEELVLPKPVG
jgi:hypothetical protein